jgi:vancomycin aglycone glucosyltransferase
MRVLLSTYESHRDVEPMVGLAVRLRALGAEMPECAAPDFAELLAGVGVGHPPRHPRDPFLEQDGGPVRRRDILSRTH